MDKQKLKYIKGMDKVFLGGKPKRINNVGLSRICCKHYSNKTKAELISIFILRILIQENNFAKL